MVLRWQGEVAADLPVQPVSGASPVYDRPWVAAQPRVPIPADDSVTDVDHRTALLRLMGCPDLASKRWIWQQYDYMVGADTVQPPGGGAAVVRVHGTSKGLALATDCTPRYCEADPRMGGMQAVAESWRNLTATGATPLAITNCLNFGNPERPPIMGQLVGCIEGMALACRALDYPVVSGNVSLYNETDGQAIQPTPAVGGVGLLADVAAMTGIRWRHEGLVLVLVGESPGWLGCSLYMREVLGREEGAPPPVELAAERRNGDFVRAMIEEGRVAACNDLADGGLLVALAEMALASGSGATLRLPEDVPSTAAWLFGEDQARYLLAVPAEHLATVAAKAREAGVIARPVGGTGGDALTLSGHLPISLTELRLASERWLPDFMAGAES
jgi:phosphoribosylformylglycinamidine synthase